MSNSAPPPKLRNWRAQGVLIGIFLLTLAGAWGTQRYRLREGRIRLDPPGEFARLWVRCPEGWMRTQLGRTLVAHEPPKRGRFGRSLEITLEHAGYFLTPLEYLTRRNDISQADAESLAGSLNAAADHAGPIEFIEIAGARGILFSRLVSIGSPKGRQAFRRQCLACAVLASNQAIVLRLEGEGAFTPVDHELIERVAQSIRFADPQPAGTGDAIALSWNMTVTAPKGFAVMPSLDRMLNGTRMAEMGGENCLEIAVAPTVLWPGVGDSKILNLAMLRDPLFGAAEARQIDQHTWACRREQNSVFPAEVFIRRAEDGRALVAEFRWITGQAGSAAMDKRVREIWNELEKSIRFEPFSGVVEARRMGVSAIAQLPNDLRALIRSPIQREKWQWFHEEATETASAEFETWMDGAAIDGASQSALTPPLSGNGSDLRQWHINSNGSGYYFRMFRGSPAEAAIAHRTRIIDGVLHCDITLGQLGDARGKEPILPDSAFIPGPLLPVVLGKLPLKPMVIQTDSITWPEPVLAPGLMTLYLEPAFDFPRHESSQEQPMRCWNIQICATGKTSRWYLRANGALERIAFPNSLHLHRLEQPNPKPNP